PGRGEGQRRGRTDLDLEVQRERETEAVEAGTEVAGGRRDPDAEGLHHRDPNARSMAASSASTRIAGEAWRMARSGSFRPWPVRVHTMRCPFGSRPSACRASSPATPAAEAGSQKTPSFWASQVQASRIAASLTAPM